MKKEAAFFAQFSTQELEEMLRLGISHPDSSYDKVLLQIMEVLHAREEERIEKEIVDKAWEEFQTYYNTPEMRGVELYGDKEELDRLLEEDLRAQEQEREARKEKVVSIRAGGVLRRLSKIAVIALVTLGVAFSSITVAQAAGIDFYGIMGTWTNNVFKFRVSENTPTSEQERATKEMQEEISAIGISDVLAPTWWPERFELYHTMYEDVEDALENVTFEYRNPEDGTGFGVFISIYHDINLLKNEEFEKDDTPPEQYTSHGRTFVILSNIDTHTATWIDGKIEVTIAGQVTRDELISIIDSIGG